MVYIHLFYPLEDKNRSIFILTVFCNECEDLVVPHEHIIVPSSYNTPYATIKVIYFPIPRIYSFSVKIGKC